MLTRWTPTPIWKAQEVYLIGGGDSLRGFDWKLLQGLHVIGLNAAVYLGVGVCSHLLFGDTKFFKKHEDALERFARDGGKVITTSRAMKVQYCPEWLHQVKKQLKGLSKDRVAWNSSTGAAAINLAFLMGAQTVYLLGFDMKDSSEGRSNFHNAYSQGTKPVAYLRFIRGMKNLKKALPEVFPGRQVINLTEDSTLEEFPKESLREHFAERKVGVS